MHFRVTSAVTALAGTFPGSVFAILSFAGLVFSGLVLAACGASDDPATSADQGPIQDGVLIEAAAPDATDGAFDRTADLTSSEQLVVEVDEGSQSAASFDSSNTTATPIAAPSTTVAPTSEQSTTTAQPTTEQATSTEASTTTAPPTTTAPTTTTTTTAVPTTTAPTTTTTAAPTTTTEQQISVLETREEVLRLAGLSTFDGGNFSPDAMSTKNIVLWFWGAH